MVEEDLDVVGGEMLWRHDDLVEVTLHQLCDHVAAHPRSRNVTPPGIHNTYDTSKYRQVTLDTH